MNKHFLKHIVLAMACIGMLGGSISAMASPQRMHGWQYDDDMDMPRHFANRGFWREGGFWAGRGYGMGMNEGHMTARMRMVWALDLTSEQRNKIRAIQHEMRSTAWDHEDAIEQLSDKLFELYRADKRDAKAIGKVYGQIFDHRRQIIEAQIVAGNKIEDVLTNEQRQQLKKWRPRPQRGSGWRDMP